jgi:hypothetical protein
MAGDAGHALIAQDNGDLMLSRQQQSLLCVICDIYLVIVLKETLDRLEYERLVVQD